eukprot:2912813-Pleurochrysis_carterae.AAC.1
MPSRRCTGPEKRRRARFGSGMERLSGTRCGGPAGRLVCVSISGLRQGCGGLRIGLPRESEFVEVHVRSGDDLVDGGHPDVVGTGREPASPKVNSDPSA